VVHDQRVHLQAEALDLVENQVDQVFHLEVVQDLAVDQEVLEVVVEAVVEVVGAKDDQNKYYFSNFYSN
jgi:hypothetical protein